MTNELFGKVIGAVLLLVGLAGFFVEGTLLGFGVNTLHNVVHLLTGALFLWGGLGGPAKDLNKWLGVVYVLVAALGFAGLLGFLNVNGADNWLHLVVGLLGAYLGFTQD
jgi:hypothetical protein